MDENKEEVMSTKTALITIGIIAVILATAVTILSLTSRKKIKPDPERIEAAAATYDSSKNTLDITTPDGNTAHFHNYSVTFEATAETTTITLNKGKTNEIIITLTEGEE